MTTSSTTPFTAAPVDEEQARARRALRDAFGTFVTGVTVVTTKTPDGQLAGCTANSFTSVSLDPPLVLWSLAHTSRNHQHFETGTRFTINVLGEHQRDLSALFSSQTADRFANSKWEPGLGGVPVLDDALCFLECSKFATYPGGDHTIYVGQVENFRHQPHRPLVFGGGRYMTAYDDPAGAASTEVLEGNRARFEAEKLAVAMLPAISGRIGRSVAVAMWGNEGPVVLYWEVNNDNVMEGIQTGHVCSLTDTATGRAFGAFLPPEVTAKTRAAHLGKAGWTDAALDQVLDSVRLKGFAIAELQQAKLISISAPVYDRSGLMMLALTTVLPLGDASSEETAVQLLKAAADVSNKLGFKG